jgi:hypothetical protein
MSRTALVTILVVLLFGFGATSAQTQDAAQPIKVYLEAPDVMAASDALKASCPTCTVVMKKEGADFLLMIGKNAAGAFRFGAFENVKGELIKEGEAASLEEAISAATAAISAKAAEPKPVPVQATGKSQIYIYRYKQFAGSALHPSVYCDSVHIADIENGRYFIVEVDAGKHPIKSSDKQAVIELTTEPGKVYYLRVEIVPGFAKGYGRMVMMMPEQGAPEVAKLKYLDAEDILNKTLVLVKPPEPVK